MTIVIPIIPFLAIEFGASAAELGLIYASYSGAQMVSVPVSGWLSDKYGRKPLIMASLMGSFFGFLVQGLATDIGTFCAGRVITGAFGGSVPIVNAYIVDLIPPPQRPKYFARLGSCVIVAFMFGPGIGAGLAQFTLRTPMFVSCGMWLCSCELYSCIRAPSWLHDLIHCLIDHPNPCSRCRNCWIWVYSRTVCVQGTGQKTGAQ